MLKLPPLVGPDGASWLFGCRVRGVDVADAVYDRFAQVPGLLDALATLSFAETCAVWDAWHTEQMGALPEPDRPILEQLNVGAFLDRVRRIRRGKLRAGLTKPVTADTTQPEPLGWGRRFDVAPEPGAGLNRSRNGHRPGSFDPPRSSQNGSAT